MTTREQVPMGAPCWIDLASTDTASTVDFYCGLFGWKAEDPNEEFGGYRNFTLDGRRVAGCMPAMDPSQAAAGWSTYLAVDDAAKTLEVAATNGAQVVVPAMAVGELGTMGVVIGPDGAPVGIWQPGTHKGILVQGEHGAPTWFELHTQAYSTALTFYRDTFHWVTHTMSDTPELRYTTVGDQDRPVAGVNDSQADGPSHWSVYFWVDDTAAALARAVELGGAMVRPAEETPYGTLGVATDRGGVEFSLMAANDMMPGRS